MKSPRISGKIIRIAREESQQLQTNQEKSSDLKVKTK